MKNNRTRQLTLAAMFSALAYILLLIGKMLPTGIVSFIPAANFLVYDPKDIIIAIAGFILGPFYALCISAVVSLIEMLSVSHTGIIGFLMNVISTCCFVCPAAFIYKKMKTKSSAILGLVVGVVCTTISMVLWNYFITPLYMGIGREVILGMMLTAFVPFNIIKASINTAFILTIYKPLVNALRKTGMMEAVADNDGEKKSGLGTWILGLFILITCIVFIVI